MIYLSSGHEIIYQAIILCIVVKIVHFDKSTTFFALQYVFYLGRKKSSTLLQFDALRVEIHFPCFIMSWNKIYSLDGT